MPVDIQTKPSAEPQSDRATLYGRALMFGVLFGFLFHVFAGSGSDTALGRLGGDFPAFYAAGKIVADGDWDSLYDLEAQAEAQAELFGEEQTEGNNLLYFAYPPPVAALYRPLAALDYRVAYTVHSLLMAALLVVALALARPLIPLLQRRFEAVVTASLLFYPALRAITGGQNTTLTLLLIVLFWRGVMRNGDVVAGLAVTGLLYKPQFALPLLGLLVWRRRPRAVGVAMGGAAVLWALSASVMGASWLTEWWEQVSDFASRDADVNAQNAVSFLGFSEAVFGASSTTARLVAAPLIAAAVLALLWIWWPGRRVDAGSLLAATATGLVVISPHAMFYDAGLLLVVGVALADRFGESAREAIWACWAIAWLQLAAPNVGLAPLFLVVLASCGAVAWLALKQGSAPPVADPAPA